MHNDAAAFPRVALACWNGGYGNESPEPSLATIAICGSFLFAALLAWVRGRRGLPAAVLSRLREACVPPSITPLEGSCLGAEVSGIDLRYKLPHHTESLLQSALCEHGMLVFRGQELRQTDVLRCASLFGQPVPAKGQTVALGIYRVKARDRQPRGQDFWHSDNSYVQRPGGPTLLYAVDVPPGPYGDTLFADAAAAAGELPQALRDRAEGCSAAHNIAHNGGVPLPEFASGQQAEEQDVFHPVLRRNPQGGREALFISPAYVRCIEGLKPRDSSALLHDLYLHMLQPQYLYRHHWRNFDLVVWDNGRLLHKATTLELPAEAERVMWRVQTIGPSAAS